MKTTITALELLKDPSKWIQGNMAKDINNNIVPYDSKEAYKFCLIGALYKVYGYGTKECDEAIKRMNVFPHINLIQFNDNHTHQEVLNLLKEAKV